MLIIVGWVESSEPTISTRAARVGSEDSTHPTIGGNMTKSIRIGLIGAGANTRLRHIPGLRAIEGIDIVAVCNRRPESAQAVAREFGIARICEHWEQLVADPDVDAVVIGTWPYLHCPITIAALRAGKHVLTEARMSMNAAEAHEMLREARSRPALVT